MTAHAPRWVAPLRAVAGAALAVVLVGGCGHDEHDGPVRFPPPHDRHAPLVEESKHELPELSAADFPTPPPPFSEGIFPCMECHESMEADPTRRELDEHTEIVLTHGPRERWCFDCHNPDDRDTLRLASGATVPFTESYRLCGQCHGDKFRDWRLGIHGKRTGEWNGAKQYLLCANCHNPHSPKFRPLEPQPAPRRPGQIATKDGRP